MKIQIKGDAANDMLDDICWDEDWLDESEI